MSKKSNNQVEIKAYLICIFGKRGSGKTTLIRGHLEEMPGPVVVIDILGNFNNDEYIQVTDVAECIDNIKYYKNYPDKSKLQKIIVLKPSDPDLAAEYISAALWESWGGTLVLDEADAINMSEAPCFNQLIRYGRNRFVNVITGCRRPAEISRDITAGANKILVFQTTEPRDIMYFESTVLGEKADDLRNIAQFTGIYVDYDERTVGQYKIDLSGKLFKLSSEALK